MKRILLSHWRAPGDIVCMTACVRDLALNHPGEYEIHVAGTYPELWRGNPYIAKAWGFQNPGYKPRFRLSCRDALMESDTVRRHYITAFHRDLERHLDVPIPVLYPKGDLHLTAAEKSDRIVEGPYWVVVAGGKRDIPVKVWPPERFQQLVTRLRRDGVRCVQAGATLQGHQHPELEGVESYVGKTNIREFLRLIHDADGVVCPVSFPMHVAAAFDKPCVVIAGGREPWWWEAYTNTSDRHFGNSFAPVRVPHRFLHTIGQFDCCRSSGCWRTHVAHSSEVGGHQICNSLVSIVGRGAAPRCLDAISVERVAESVLELNNSARFRPSRVSEVAW